MELVRGRLTIAGPITAAALARSLAVPEAAAEAALLRLEAEGGVLRGRFTPREASAGSIVEWCDRALLARMHRYTVNRLRAEIAPVSATDFMRFLLCWQHVEPRARLVGVDGVREVVAALDGFELAARAWERAVLPCRVDGFEPAMLDMLCLSGEVAWGRVSGPRASASPPQLGPGTPIALFLREHADAWQAVRPVEDEPAAQPLGEEAARVLDLLRVQGPSFLSDLERASRLAGDRLRQTLGALVAAGLVRSDGFAGLRLLLRSAVGRPPGPDRAGQFAGRWAAVRRSSPTPDERARAVERQAWALLRRYGIIFRRLLVREPNAAPWRELTRVYRRLEARGEICGGRFVAGMSGEQFALAEAVERMREVRRSPRDGRLTIVGTADPLNLVGILTPGDRLRPAVRNQLAYVDGLPVAVLEGTDMRELTPLDAATKLNVARALIRRRAPLPV